MPSQVPNSRYHQPPQYGIYFSLALQKGRIRSRLLLLLPPGIKLTKWLRYVNARWIGLYWEPASRGGVLRSVVNHSIKLLLHKRIGWGDTSSKFTEANVRQYLSDTKVKF